MKFEEVTPKYLGELENEVDISFMKEFTQEQKVDLFKQILLQEDIKCANLILNIILVINGISDTEDSFFERPDVIFNSIDEYVDIKLELKNEINIYSEKVIAYYLGIIKGLTVRLDDIRIHVPNNYWNFFIGTDINAISKIMNNYGKSIDLNKISPVFNADILFSEIISKNNLFGEFLSNLIKEFPQNKEEK